MNTALIIIFIILGIALLILEIFFLPGTSIAGIAGGAFLIVAVWVAFSAFGAKVGWYSVAGIIVVFGLSLYIFLKAGVMDKISLKTEIDGKVEAKDEIIKAGDRGIASSRLAPIGNAEIDGFVVEVKSITGFVDAGAEIEVISVNKQEILVKSINKN